MKSIFSKIIDKEIPCHLVAENHDAIAFMDINPIVLGHVLVVPKIECDNLFDLDDDNYRCLWMFVKKIQISIKEVIKCKRIGVSVAGFEVPHAHIHLLPINSIQDLNFNNKYTISSSDLSLLARDISKKIQFNSSF